MGRKKKEAAGKEPQSAAPAATETKDAQGQAQKPLKLKIDEEMAKNPELVEPNEKGEYNTLGAERAEYSADDPEDLFAEVLYAELENGKWISAAQAKSDSMTAVFIEELLTAKEQHDCEAFAVIAALHRLTLALETHKEDEAVKAVIGKIGSSVLDWKLKADAFVATQPKSTTASEQKTEATKKEELPKADAAVNKIRRTLFCKLSPAEWEMQAQNLDKIRAAIESEEMAKKDDNKRHTDKITTLTTELNDAIKVHASGSIEKEVDCEWIFGDPKPGKKTLYRLDTGVVIEGPCDIKNKELEQPLPIDGKDSKDSTKAAAPKPQTKAEEPKKLGDRGATFIFAAGDALPIVDYEEVKNEIKPGELMKMGDATAKFESAKVSCLDIPSRAGVKSLVRAEEDGKTVYLIWKHSDAKERVAKAKEALAALASAKVEGGEPGKQTAETAASPETHQAPAPGESQDSILTEEDKSRGVAWCCTKCGFTIGEAEAVLRREGKLSFTKGLHEQPLAAKYMIDNISQVERWILELRKEEKAKKSAA